jgi:hypothetical protein
MAGLKPDADSSKFRDARLQHLMQCRSLLAQLGGLRWAADGDDHRPALESAAQRRRAAISAVGVKAEAHDRRGDPVEQASVVQESCDGTSRKNFGCGFAGRTH